MKQSIQLKMGQHLTMTPQLQQAIKLLQLPTIELQNEIQQFLESNPMLETEEDIETATKTEEKKEAVETETREVAEIDEAPASSSEIDLANGDMTNEGIDNDWADDEWKMDYTSSTGSTKNNDDFNDRDIFANQSIEDASIQEHLKWQLNLTPMTDTDRAIGMAIIDSINDDGYLNDDLDAIYLALRKHVEIDMDEVETVLHRIQHFDPIGVAARTPEECLLLQLLTFSDDPALPLAKKIVQEHLPLLASHDYAKLKRLLKIDDSALAAAEKLIQSLTPKPGAAISTSHTEYIVPDVFVYRHKGAWKLELNPDLAPKIRINSMYAGMVKRADKSADNNFLKSNLQEARWFLKSLQSRNDTILKVATSIIERQKDFLDVGDEAMKPLVLRDIADELQMHESTISRVTNQKYIHTPRGIYEFKHFFSSHVGTADGGECSATAIRAMIKKLVAAENVKKPLSDSKISSMLGKEGINVARRTVAKYRESMQIPPSNERKRLA